MEQTAEAAFDMLIRQYVNKVLRLVYLIVKDRNLAEDITQDVFMKAYQNIGSFRKESGDSRDLRRSRLHQLTPGPQKAERTAGKGGDGMDLEQILREFKETADRTFLRPLDDTADLENRIRAGIHKRSRRNVIRTITVASLAAAALMFVIVLPQPNSGGQNHVTTAPAHDATPDDAAILQKVEEIKESLRIGLTQDKVLKRINGSPTIVDDNGDLESGADEFWNYSFFRQEGYAPKEPFYVVDEEGLRGRKTGANLFIGWKEKKLYFYSITYVQGEKNDIVFFLMRSNGTVSEETLGVQQAPSVFDLSPELKDLYFAYMKEKKDELLKGLTPIDIFKLYVHAEEEGDLHTQYALYIQDEKSRRWNSFWRM